MELLSVISEVNKSVFLWRCLLPFGLFLFTSHKIFFKNSSSFNGLCLAITNVYLRTNVRLNKSDPHIEVTLHFYLYIYLFSQERDPSESFGSEVVELSHFEEGTFGQRYHWLTGHSTNTWWQEWVMIKSW